MKKTVFMILVFLVAIQTVGFSQKKRDRIKVKADTISVDTLEYKLVVLDPGFETWLLTKPPENFYSKDYYAERNRWYVSEWNQRYMSSNDNDLYDSSIDYNPRIDYGITLNYRLYYYFRYFEEVNHVRLVNFGR